MRRIAIVSIVGVLGTFCVQSELVACGDMFVVPPGIQEHPNQVEPSKILIYRSPESGLIAGFLADPDLQLDLQNEGHKVVVCDDYEVLASELESESYHLILAPIDEALNLGERVGGRSIDTLIVPVLDEEDERDKQLAGSFRYSIQSPQSVSDLIRNVNKALVRVN